MIQNTIGQKGSRPAATSSASRAGLRPKRRRPGATIALEHSARWHRLCAEFLPFEVAGTFWRASRHARAGEPNQGWKLHISATVLQACDLFERVAPVLARRDLCFKAPNSLNELMQLNSGSNYGYWQVGKFLTVYASDAAEVVEVAAELHDLTRDFVSISIPFDNQYIPGSNVFYRYGAFGDLKMMDANGVTLPAIEGPGGVLVYDDRLVAVPAWITDPFRQTTSEADVDTSQPSPLGTTYRVFAAITQRGKGGTYRAVDLSSTPPRLCVVKEGRRHGEVSWDGDDGRDLVENEHRSLTALGMVSSETPQVYGSFESDGNFYFAMEHVDGVSLQKLMMRRRRRFSIRQTLEFAVKIARLIENLNRVGWIWNDCKPSNLIVTATGKIRAIDFENSYPVNSAARFQWATREYSTQFGTSGDAYALGAVIYVLLTARFYDFERPEPIDLLRRNVPARLKSLVNGLLGESTPSVENARRELESIALDHKVAVI